MNSRKVIFYLIDGARPDILNQLVNRGLLPNIQKYLIEEGSYVMGTTCIPSTTGPAYLPFLTGRFPGEHDITGIRWFDKHIYYKGRWTRNSMRSYCGYEAKYFNDDMNPQYPSLFEIYPDSLNIYNMVTKGLRNENDLARKEKNGLYYQAHFRHKHHPVDLNGHEKLMQGLDREYRLIFAVFPSIDWDSHTYHFEDERTIRAYQIADNSLGEVVDKLKKKGEYENHMIIMVSDHGLSSTHTHFDLGKFFRKNRYRVLEYPTIWTIHPKVAVFISGNSFATLSFLDQRTLHTKDSLMKSHKRVLEKMIDNKAVDFVVMRKVPGTLSVLNRDGEAEVVVKNEKVGYRSLSSNPLGLPDTRELLDTADAFHFTFESSYPDSLIQIKQFMSSERSGDVAVFASIGYDLRDFWEIPEHKGSHGSLHREHMHVPILSNKPGLLEEPIRTTQIYQIIRSYLGN